MNRPAQILLALALSAPLAHAQPTHQTAAKPVADAPLTSPLASLGLVGVVLAGWGLHFHRWGIFRPGTKDDHDLHM